MGYIYQIYCDLENIKSVYIGKTNRSVEERFQEHLEEARHNRRNFKFYNAIRKYGQEHFHYIILGNYTDEELNQWEIYWIEYYNSFLDGWNSTAGGDGNIIWTDEMKEKHSEIMKEYYTQHPISQEQKNKQSKTMKANWSNPDFQKKMKEAHQKAFAEHPERKAAQSQRNIERYKDPSAREISRQAQLKRWSDPEEHTKASQSHIKSHGKKVRCIETGEIYSCIADANEAHGKSRKSSAISSCLRGANKTAHGYHWELIIEEEKK